MGMRKILNCCRSILCEWIRKKNCIETWSFECSNLTFLLMSDQHHYWYKYSQHKNDLSKKTCSKKVRKAGMQFMHKILKNWSRKRRERQTSVLHTLGWRSIAGFDHVKLLPSLEWRSNAGISEEKCTSAMKNCRLHRGNTYKKKLGYDDSYLCEDGKFYHK